LQHQAGAVEQLDKRVLGSGHDMHLYLAGRPAISFYCLPGSERRGWMHGCSARYEAFRGG